VPEITENDVNPQEAAAPVDLGGRLVLSDVYLLTSESEGRVAVPGLTVVLDDSGLTVRKPDGAIGAVVAWTDVTALEASRRMRTPAGSQGVVIEARTASRTHSFVVPTDDPGGLEQEIARFAGAMAPPARRAQARSKRRSGVLVTALAVAIVAGIVLAVLVAAGAVKF
jgi:hypothetical protein